MGQYCTVQSLLNVTLSGQFGFLKLLLNVYIRRFGAQRAEWLYEWECLSALTDYSFIFISQLDTRVRYCAVVCNIYCNIYWLTIFASWHLCTRLNITISPSSPRLRNADQFICWAKPNQYTNTAADPGISGRAGLKELKVELKSLTNKKLKEMIAHQCWFIITDYQAIFLSNLPDPCVPDFPLCLAPSHISPPTLPGALNSCLLT